MAKRKVEKSKAGAAPAISTMDAAPPPLPGKWWPEDFLAPAPSLIIFIAGIVASLVIVFLMLNNGLVGFKQTIAYFLGLDNPYDVGLTPSSMDAGAVILGFIWTLVGAAIHPAVGIAVLALLRPWLDGFTFPTDNMYFVWGSLLCFAIWGVRTVMRGGEVRAWKPMLFFAAYPAMAWLLAGQSINYNDTYRALVIYPTYVILFFMIANLAAKPQIFRFLVGSIAFVISLQAVYAIMQYRYILPFLRLQIQNDPNIMAQYFGVADPSAELARRFNINRAFGTVLFPNALAAFLILWIPLFASCTWNNFCTWRALSGTRQIGNKKTFSDLLATAALGFCTWFVFVVGIYFLMQFPATYLPANEVPAYYGTYAAMFISSGLALFPAVGLYLVALARDVRYALTVARTAAYAFALLVGVYTLAITFTRGAMLGLLVGAVSAIAALVIPRDKWLARLPVYLRGALTASAALLMVFLFTAQAPAPSAPPSASTGEVQTKPGAAAFNPKPSENPPQRPPDTGITTKGQNVTGGDLMSGASFKARFTYWRVGLKMFLDNPWAGVGLRNFAWAYPKYQYLGANDVREAHNGFLQGYCETGIVGGTLLLAFWVYVCIAGLLRTIRETDRARKLLYAGITGGLIAFIFHTSMDINFSHPTLMFFLSVAAGFLFALDPPPAPSKTSHLIVLPVLLAAALVSGMGLRVFAQDLAIGRISLISVADYDKKTNSEMDNRLNVGRYFLITVPDRAKAKKPAPAVYFASARNFITDVQVLANLGPLFTVDAERKQHRVQPGEEIPPNALLAVNKPWAARKLALDAAEKYVTEVEAIDARFPYNANIASYLSEWYDAMAHCADTPRLKDQNVKYAERMIHWAEEACKRNYWHSGLIENLGMKYWDKAEMVRDRDNREEYAKAYDTMRLAAKYAPVTPDYSGAVATAGKLLTQAYERAGLKDKAAEFQKESEVYAERAGELIRRRIELGIDPPPPSQPQQPAASANQNGAKKQ